MYGQWGDLKVGNALEIDIEGYSAEEAQESAKT
jgi:hypothetical protein